MSRKNSNCSVQNGCCFIVEFLEYFICMYLSGNFERRHTVKHYIIYVLFVSIKIHITMEHTTPRTINKRKLICFFN